MAETDDSSRVWNLVDKIGFCMLSTRSGEHTKARPILLCIWNTITGWVVTLRHGEQLMISRPRWPISIPR